jgi:2-methylcitrate dehydratase PrpD
MTHFLESGTAARAGVLSAFLAAEGFEAADYVFEGLNGNQLGYFKLLSDSQPPPSDVLFASWGSPYRVLEVGVKQYPVCSLHQPIIQGLLSRRQSEELPIAEIDHIDVVGNGTLAELCDIPNPTTHSAAGMSLQHVIATVLIDGDVAIDSLSHEHLVDPTIASLRSRVRLRVDDKYPLGLFASPTLVTVALNSGRTVRMSADSHHGLPPDFLSHEEVVAKFRRSVNDLLSERRMDDIIEAVSELENLGDVGHLIQMLVP